MRIRTENLGKVFRLNGLRSVHGRSVQALSDINLEAQPGSIHALMGPNGSGKSTLLRILATLVLPTTGSAFIGDTDVVREPLHARRLIGFSGGDERGLYWRLTGRQNLEFYAGLRRLPRNHPCVEDALASVDLEDVADRPVRTYSQGMARRLGLARAMLGDPAVLLLDEPTRSLDPNARERLHEVLKAISRRQNVTMLLATHELSDAAAVCDRVTVLARGQVVDELDPGDRAAIRLALRAAAV
jgi:ABC-2 type transport system ATP-binding protein